MKSSNEIVLIVLLILIVFTIIFQKQIEQLYIKYILKRNIVQDPNKQLNYDLKKNNEYKDSNSVSCTGTNKEGSCVYNSNGTKKRILPVLDPLFNLREICKQIILLEDHLSQKGKRCHDCISKHFLYLEGLAEEAITLDRDMKHIEKIENLPDEFRTLQKEYLSNIDPLIISQKLRKIRKIYMEDSFKFSKKC